ncbi:NADP-dependent oxidoreductase domain-containing protein [Rhizoctonia solani]|nr:NADP-dependent oxidoreductase domain-containing protein [Rhizoctonia solani]
MAQTTTIAGNTIFKIGHGLMTMTWPESKPDEQNFASLKAGIEAAPPGVKVFLNGGEFYGDGLELLNRFYTKYPEYAERTFFKNAGPKPAGIERSINTITERLGPNKKIDLFQPTRVDSNVSIEETMATLNKYGSIGVSECSEATLVRASKVAKVAALEIERLIATAQKLGTIVAAYSPLGRGFLTGKFNQEELSKQDYRNGLPSQTFRPQNNMKLVNALKEIAEKNITPAQLCLVWVCSIGPHIVPIPGSTRAERTQENFASVSVALTAEDQADINRALELNPVSGDRYGAGLVDLNWG